jgi:hypothetical protein
MKQNRKQKEKEPEQKKGRQPNWAAPGAQPGNSPAADPQPSFFSFLLPLTGGTHLTGRLPPPAGKLARDRAPPCRYSSLKSSVTPCLMRLPSAPIKPPHTPLCFPSSPRSNLPPGCSNFGSQACRRRRLRSPIPAPLVNVVLPLPS